MLFVSWCVVCSLAPAPCPTPSWHLLLLLLLLLLALPQLRVCPRCWGGGGLGWREARLSMKSLDGQERGVARCLPEAPVGACLDDEGERENI